MESEKLLTVDKQPLLLKTNSSDSILFSSPKRGRPFLLPSYLSSPRNGLYAGSSSFPLCSPPRILSPSPRFANTFSFQEFSKLNTPRNCNVNTSGNANNDSSGKTGAYPQDEEDPSGNVLDDMSIFPEFFDVHAVSESFNISVGGTEPEIEPKTPRSKQKSNSKNDMSMRPFLSLKSPKGRGIMEPEIEQPSLADFQMRFSLTPRNCAPFSSFSQIETHKRQRVSIDPENNCSRNNTKPEDIFSSTGLTPKASDSKFEDVPKLNSNEDNHTKDLKQTPSTVIPKASVVEGKMAKESERAKMSIDFLKLVKKSSKEIEKKDGNKNAEFFCPHKGCKRKFSWKWAMEEHAKTHLQDSERIHACTYCGKKFFTIGCLKSHTRIHTRKPNSYICKEEGCGKTYSTSEGLRLHTRNHHDLDKKWKCPEVGCGKSFVRQSDMRLHIIRIHSDTRPYPCNSCTKSFACYSELKRHEICHEKKRKRKEAKERAKAEKAAKALAKKKLKASTKKPLG